MGKKYYNIGYKTLFDGGRNSLLMERTYGLGITVLNMYQQASAGARIADKSHNDDEIDYYAYLDFLSYIPFEKVGYDYLDERLKKKGKNLFDVRYEHTIKTLTEYFGKIGEETKEDVRQFLNSYYNDDVLELNARNWTIIALRVYQRYDVKRVFDKEVSRGGANDLMWRMAKELSDKKEININDYLPAFDYSNKLTDSMIAYMKKCWRNARFAQDEIEW